MEKDPYKKLQSMAEAIETKDIEVVKAVNLECEDMSIKFGYLVRKERLSEEGRASEFTIVVGNLAVCFVGTVSYKLEFRCPQEAALYVRKLCCLFPDRG